MQEDDQEKDQRKSYLLGKIFRSWRRKIPCFHEMRAQSEATIGRIKHTLFSSFRRCFILISWSISTRHFFNQRPNDTKTNRQSVRSRMKELHHLLMKGRGVCELLVSEICPRRTNRPRGGFDALEHPHHMNWTYGSHNLLHHLPHLDVW